MGVQGNSIGIAWEDNGTTNGYVRRPVGFDGTAANAPVLSITYTYEIPDTVPPTVTLTAPTEGSTVHGSTIALAATATDNGTMARVDFYADSTLIASDYTAPYTAQWDSTLYVSGLHTLRAVAYDTAALSSSSAVNVNLDNSLPTGTISINNGAVATNTRAVTLYLSATDENSAVTRMAFSTNGTTWSSTVAYAPTYAYTLPSGAGVKTVYARFTDAAGNVSAPASDTIIYDNSAPNSASISVNAGAAATNSREVTLTLSAVDTVSGVATMIFSNDGTVWTTPVPYATSYRYTLPVGDGTKTVRVRFTDFAGNTSNSVSDSIVLNTVAPTVTLTAPAAGSTVRGTVPLAATASDTNGIARVEFYVDDLLVGTDTSSPYTSSWNSATGSDGSHTVRAIGYDNASNTTTSSATVTVDNTVPSGSISIDAGAAYTTDTQVALTLSAADAGSGVSTMAFSNDGTTWSTPVAYATTYAYTLPTGDGAKTVYVRFTDVAGNVSAVVSDAISLDSTAPAGGSVTIDGGAAYTTDTDVALTLSATDAGSGVSTMAFSNDGTTWSTPVAYATTYAYALPAGDGTKTVYVRFTDVAGNVSAAATDGIALDTTSPTATLTAPSGGSVVSGAVALAATASDNLGVSRVDFYDGVTLIGSDASAPYTASWDSTGSSDGVHTLRAVAVDGAAHTATDTVAVTVDNTAPAVSAVSVTAISETAATVTWTTDEPSTSQVEYGTTPAYGSQTPPDATLVTSHSVTVSGLSAATTYNFRVVSSDARSNRTTSGNATFTTPDSTAPAVSLTAPADGASVSGTVALAATAGDNVGVTRVDFYVDTTLVGSDATVPYTASWDSALYADGSHTVRAEAYDAAGNSRSSSVNVDPRQHRSGDLERQRGLGHPDRRHDHVDHERALDLAGRVRADHRLRLRQPRRPHAEHDAHRPADRAWLGDCVQLPRAFRRRVGQRLGLGQQQLHDARAARHHQPDGEPHRAGCQRGSRGRRGARRHRLRQCGRHQGRLLRRRGPSRFRLHGALRRDLGQHVSG